LNGLCQLATSYEGTQIFKQRVKDNYFYTSDQVEKLISETENVFASCLEGGDKARAMKKLRVPPLGGKVRWSDGKHVHTHTLTHSLVLF